MAVTHTHSTVSSVFHLEKAAELSNHCNVGFMYSEALRIMTYTLDSRQVTSSHREETTFILMCVISAYNCVLLSLIWISAGNLLPNSRHNRKPLFTLRHIHPHCSSRCCDIPTCSYVSVGSQQVTWKVMVQG